VLSYPTTPRGSQKTQRTLSTNVNKCQQDEQDVFCTDAATLFRWKNFVTKIAGTVEKGTLPQSQTHRKKLEKHDSSAIHGCVHD